MPPAYILDILQWSITVTGIPAFYYAVVTWRMARQEQLALRERGVNGDMKKLAGYHLFTASSRMLSASLSIVCGFILTQQPDWATGMGVMSGAVWFIYNICMTMNMIVEVRARDCQCGYVFTPRKVER